jgi:hypothetical protein
MSRVSLGFIPPQLPSLTDPLKRLVELDDTARDVREGGR